MLFNRPDTPKVTLPVANLHPHVIHVPWTLLTQHPKLHLDRFSRFCTAHGRESNVRENAINSRFKIIISAINATKTYRSTALL